MTEIKNIGGSIGFDKEGNTYTRDCVLDSQDKRTWGEWRLNNQMGCSGRDMEYYEEQHKKYIKIQEVCK